MVSPCLHHGAPQFQQIRNRVARLDALFDVSKRPLSHVSLYASLSAPVAEAGTETVRRRFDFGACQSVAERLAIADSRRDGSRGRSGGLYWDATRRIVGE